MARPSSPPPRPGAPVEKTKGGIEVRVKPGARPGAEVHEIEYESDPPPAMASERPTPELGRPQPLAPHEQPTSPPRAGAKQQGSAIAKAPALQRGSTADLTEPARPKPPAAWTDRGDAREDLRSTSSGLGIPAPGFGSDTDFDAIEKPPPPTRRTEPHESPRAGGTDLGFDLGDDPNDALDLVGRRDGGSFAPAPAKGDPLSELRERYALGDFSGALTIAEGILEDNKHNVDAQRYAESCRDVLRQMYAARLGPLDQVPVVAIPVEQLRWLTLDHRAGFLLSHVDGVSTLEEILDISGMPPLEAMRIIYELLQQKVIALQ